MEILNTIFDATLLNSTFQIWVSVFCTLMMMSMLYRDNPIYQLGENVFLGISIGYTWVISWEQVVVPFLVKPLMDMTVEFKPYDLTIFIWLALGSTLLFRFSRNKSWVANYYFAYIFAYTAGFAIPLYVQLILVDVGNLMQPINQGNWFDSTKWFVLIFGVAASLAYFFFSKPHQGALGKVARTGILIMMICFGASFGTTIMGRVALFIGRAQLLVANPIPSIVSTIIMIILLFVYFKFIHKEKAFQDEEAN